MSFLMPQQDQQQGVAGQTPGMPGTPPPQTGSAGAGTAKAGPSQGTPTQFGSSASKLGDYLNANQAQIGQQTQGLTNQLNQQYQTVSGDITNNANAFNAQVQNGYTAANPGLLADAAKDVVGFAANPKNVSDFQAQYNDTYKGPTSYETTSPYGQVQGEVSQAVQNAGLLGTSTGLTNYLQGQYKNPTRAEATLDSLLMNQDPASKQAIQAAAAKFGGLTDQFNTSVTGADAGVKSAQDAAAATQKYTRDTANQYVNEWGKNLTDSATAAEGKRTGYNQAVQDTQHALDPVQQNVKQYLSLTGYNPTGGSGVGAYDLQGAFNPFASLQPIANPVTTANYATPEQYAQAAAIQQLLNGTGTLPIDQTTAAQAGTAPTVGANPSADLGSIARNLGYNTEHAEQDNGTGTNGNFLTAYSNHDSPYNSLMRQLYALTPGAFTDPNGNPLPFQQ